MTSTAANTNVPEHDSIVTINAGGTIFQALRSTLCLPPGDDVAFKKLFEENLESDTVFFLDHDPELIAIVLNFLRAKKIEDPFDPIVEPPVVPDAKRSDFRRLLNYYGLTAFFFYPSTAPVTMHVATTMAVPVEELSTTTNRRSMSFDSHDLVDVTAATATAAAVKAKRNNLQDSASLRTEDSSIVENFDYCYG